MKVADWQLRAGELAGHLDAMLGYLMNAKIDLETGRPKRTAINTIEGGIQRARRALEEHRLPTSPNSEGAKTDG